MSKLLISILIILLPVIGFTKKNQDLKSYYALTNKAELFICQGQHQKSLDAYKKAFKINANHYSLDLYNAALLAMDLKDYKTAYQLSMKLAEKGIGDQFFEKKSEFILLKQHSNNDWMKLISVAKNQQKYYTTKNKKLNEKLLDLFTRDQEVHFRNLRNDSTLSEQMLNSTDDSISKILYSIIQENGFLSEFNLGIQTENDTTILSVPQFYIIIRHNFQGIQKYDTLFNQVCRQSLTKGILHPYVYANMRDANPVNGNMFFGTSHLFVKYKCAVYISDEFTDSKKIEEIDSLREIYWMPKVEESLVKIKYKLENPRSGFRFKEHISSIGSFGNPDSEKSFLKSSKVLIENINGCK
ncbi:MAG: hypothetical protein LBV59_11775 [Sphingobacterium sp.]|jgi:hypothetical protein|uniref:hypothetical protein n=1 Tax=Sphingobacterium sp. TaxID=341027 RepID=UPI00284CDBEF|nr:hypothetical protein [Sphingobacterium sp.]MDR3008607.1 hypothetical protein [Sphingobacterium sp.]